MFGLSFRARVQSPAETGRDSYNVSIPKGYIQTRCEHTMNAGKHSNWKNLIAVAVIFIASRIASAAEPASGPQSQKAEIRVGINDGDFRGSDHRVLQAAVDYVAALGGGTVRIGPGRYLMRNALALRNGVNVVGTPGETVLVACDGFRSRLVADGDCNERQITVGDASGFRIGDGVAIEDTQTHGFMVTTATLTSQTGSQTFGISEPLYLDYMVSNKAVAKLAFPVIGGWKIKNATVEGILIEGNGEKAESLNGCRGAGIYLFECEQVAIRNCDVRNYNGDGISFQVSSHVTVEDCVVRNNAVLGIHPGSGSQRPIVRRNRSLENGSDGLFVCWRVRHGLFEQNEIRGNKRAGVSIGHKDTDNLFRDNTITANSSAGVLFRKESEAMGAHRNVFENNRILDNGGKDSNTAAAIVIDGSHHDLVFRDNSIGNSQPGGKANVGILVRGEAPNLQAEEKQFLNVEKRIERKK
jgi:parallel beta-helix repeat protein